MRVAVDTGKPVIVVLTAGSAISANYAAKQATALLVAWYGGEEAGTAIADALAGAHNQPSGPPAGHLLQGRRSAPTLRRLRDEGPHLPLFRGRDALPFGFGLSYSSNRHDRRTDLRLSGGLPCRVSVVARQVARFTKIAPGPPRAGTSGNGE